jgi:hypothetical protein
MKNTPLILAARILALLAFVGTAAAQPELTLTADFNQTLHVLRGGIGASWHAMETPIPVVGDRSHGGSGWGGYPPAGDAAAWRQIYRHADWLGLDFCRVEVEQRIYEPERNQFTWDSPEMKILYRIHYQVTSQQKDNPNLKIAPVSKVPLKAGEAVFSDELPAMSLTIYSTYNLGATDKGIIAE